jgi:hypothetical protein
MSSKMYRTALGKQVDMGALLSKNENVRAIGNMGVNARGDIINKKNETVTTKADIVNQQYRKQIRNQIEDVPVNIKEVREESDLSIDGFDNPLTHEIEEGTEVVESDISSEVKDSPVVAKKPSGLASAIAKARAVEQKKLKTPREKSRETKGVKKI